MREPLAITDCLNFGNPEKPEIFWQIEKSADGMSEACRKLETPVIGGNVSMYNERSGEAVYPTPTNWDGWTCRRFRTCNNTRI